MLSGYGRDSLDNELDMELDDDVEEPDGFTEDRSVGGFFFLDLYIMELHL